MSWTLITTGTASWTVTSQQTAVDGRILFAGMPMGLLLSLTYDAESYIGWPVVSTATSSWTVVT